MIKYLIFNIKTKQELEYDDIIHARSAIKHYILQEHKDASEMSDNWRLISHVY